MNKKVITEEILIPKIICCGYCCGDCIYMDLNSTNTYGEAWCGKRQKYYPPADNASYCNEFHER